MVRKSKPYAGGNNYLKRTGKRAVMVTLEPTDHGLIQSAAAADGRSMSQFIGRSAVTAAKKIMEKVAKSA